MAFKCETCAKGTMWGHKVSHSKQRTNRGFRPNLQNKKIDVGGKMISVKMCTNCIKLLRKQTKDAVTKLQLQAEKVASTLSA